MKQITIANRENKTFEVKGHKPLLQELRAHGVDLPYGCQYGGCITCAAKLIKGEIVSAEESGLSKREWNELMEAFDLKDKLI